MKYLNYNKHLSVEENICLTDHNFNRNAKFTIKENIEKLTNSTTILEINEDNTSYDINEAGKT